MVGAGEHPAGGGIRGQTLPSVGEQVLMYWTHRSEVSLSWDWGACGEGAVEAGLGTGAAEAGTRSFCYIGQRDRLVG